MTPQESDFHVFVIRARQEPREIPGAAPEWRFWIEHHPSGTQHYYRDFADVLAFISAFLPADATERVVAPPSE